ncbi:MAG: J domain-containing protein [Verrucomicrobia bacterium]|nr:J domain-containing protein [Verrucomicrobiota bacterium]
MDAFALLGLPARPLLAEDEIVRAFDAAALTAHPDRGGQAADFAALEEARRVLTDPATRLRHLLARETGAEPGRGPAEVPVVIGEAFTRATAVCAAADTLLARRAAATSALAKAMLAAPALEVRERVEAWLGELSELRTAAETALARFDADWQAGQRPLEALRDLAQIFAFLSRWTSQGRERLFALTEV